MWRQRPPEASSFSHPPTTRSTVWGDARNLRSLHDCAEALLLVSAAIRHSEYGSEFACTLVKCINMAATAHPKSAPSGSEDTDITRRLPIYSSEESCNRQAELFRAGRKTYRASAERHRDASRPTIVLDRHRNFEGTIKLMDRRTNTCGNIIEMINDADRQPVSDHLPRAAVVLPYLTTSEVAIYLRLSKRTVREKIRAGVFLEGRHFFRPPGCQVRWKWDAIVRWLEGKPTST